MSLRAPHPDASSEPARIGAKLRASRQRQGLTIEQLAVAANLTKGFLSRLERDLTSPSVATLAALCQILSIPIGTLFEEPDVAVVSGADAPAINMGGVDADEQLLTPRNEQRLQVIRSTTRAGGGGGEQLYTINCDVESMHVVSGQVVVSFTGRDLTLGPGDTVTFPGAEPHTWRAQTAAEVLWVLVPAAWSGSSPTPLRS